MAQFTEQKSSISEQIENRLNSSQPRKMNAFSVTGAFHQRYAVLALAAKVARNLENIGLHAYLDTQDNQARAKKFSLVM